MATTTLPSPPPPLVHRGCPLTRPYTIRGMQANLPHRNRNCNRPRHYYNHHLPDSVTNTAATSLPLHQPPPRHPYVCHHSNPTFAAPAPPHLTHPTPPPHRHVRRRPDTTSAAPPHPTPPDAAHPKHPTPPPHI